MNKLDRRFISKDVEIVVRGILNTPPANPITGDRVIVGTNGTGDFLSKTPEDIAIYNGTVWDFISPTIDETEVIDISNGNVLRYTTVGTGNEEVTKWVVIGNLSSASPTIVRELFTVTAEDVSNGYVELTEIIPNMTFNGKEQAWIFHNGLLAGYAEIVEDEGTYKVIIDYNHVDIEVKEEDEIVVYCYGTFVS